MTSETQPVQLILEQEDWNSTWKKNAVFKNMNPCAAKCWRKTGDRLVF